MYIVFQPRFESSTLKNLKNDTPLAFIVPCSGKWCLTYIWPPFWPCKSENGYLVTVLCQIIQNHPRMLHFKVPRKHSWFWRSWRSNGGQNKVGLLRQWHSRKIWTKIELCAKKIPNPSKTVAANPPPWSSLVERPLFHFPITFSDLTKKLYLNDRPRCHKVPDFTNQKNMYIFNIFL